MYPLLHPSVFHPFIRHHYVPNSSSIYFSSIHPSSLCTQFFIHLFFIHPSIHDHPGLSPVGLNASPSQAGRENQAGPVTEPRRRNRYMHKLSTDIRRLLGSLAGQGAHERIHESLSVCELPS
jgi:hypothetical protein